MHYNFPNVSYSSCSINPRIYQLRDLQKHGTMRWSTRCQHGLLLAASLFFLYLWTTVDAEIYFDDCTTEADNPPSTKDGGRYMFNLCVKDEEFSGEKHPWTFRETQIKESSFDDCHFENGREAMNFTGSIWETVTIQNSYFRRTGQGKKKIEFRRASFRDVVFSNVEFEGSAEIWFREFEFNNVTFQNCFFRGKLVMLEGSMNNVKFENTTFGPEAGVLPSERRGEIIFTRVTIREAEFTDSMFASTLRVYGAQLADVNFNRTDFNKFYCVSKSKENPQASIWNDTAFDDLTFNGDVECKGSTWRGIFMKKINIYKGFDFSRTRILDMAWNRLTQRRAINDRDCHVFNLTEARIKREKLHNVRGVCRLELENAKMERINVKNISSKEAALRGTTFSDQEYVAGECCTRVCEKRGCICNITRPSGKCPSGSNKVRGDDDDACFPADSRLTLENGGLVRMEDVVAGHRVAVDQDIHSDVFFFGHKRPEVLSEYVRIDTSFSESSGGSPLRISPGHYMYVNGKMATARTVQVGDTLRLKDGSPTPVLSVKKETRRGLFAPTTLHGDLVVDGIVVSSYTDAVHPRLAHALLHPVRLAYRIGLKSITERFTMFHKKDWGFLPRTLRIPRGPMVL